MVRRHSKLGKETKVGPLSIATWGKDIKIRYNMTIPTWGKEKVICSRAEGRDRLYNFVHSN